MKIKNKGGYVVPVAMGVLVVASLGLLIFSWWGRSQTINNTSVVQKETSTTSSLSNKQSLMSDDATLDADSATIDAQIKALDDSNVDVGNSLNDSSSI